MAKRKKKSTGHRRKRKSSGKRTRSRRGGSRGKKWKVAMPKMIALKIAAAIIVGGVIADVLEELGYDVVPDQLSAKAGGLWVYAVATGNDLFQQVAYGMEADHLAEEYELTDSITETVTELLEGFGLGGDALPPGDEELEELEEGVGVG